MPQELPQQLAQKQLPQQQQQQPVENICLEAPVQELPTDAPTSTVPMEVDVISTVKMEVKTEPQFKEGSSSPLVNLMSPKHEMNIDSCLADTGEFIWNEIYNYFKNKLFNNDKKSQLESSNISNQYGVNNLIFIKYLQNVEMESSIIYSWTKFAYFRFNIGAQISASLHEWIIFVWCHL